VETFAQEVAGRDGQPLPDRLFFHRFFKNGLGLPRFFFGHAFFLCRGALPFGGKALALQPREFKLLECLMQHAGQVLTRTMLLEKVWDYQFDPHTNVVDVHIARLRQKVDRGFEPPLIHTVRGSGYRLSLDT